MSANGERPHRPLRALATLFLKLGFIGFGGPAAHIALMEEEVVRRRGWLDRQRFLDMVGATNLIPGPNSTEMAMHVGFVRAGGRGLVVAGLAFILPAASITAVLAWAYLRYGSLPSVTPLLAGVKPAVLAVVFGALWRLGRVAARTPALAALAALAAAAVLAGGDEVLTLLAVSLLGGALLLFARPATPPGPAATLPGGLLGSGAAVAAAGQGTGLAWGSGAAAVPAGAAGPSVVGAGAAFGSGAVAVATGIPLWKLALFFLKVGAVLYGSGYVLVAFLEGGLVEGYGWLTRAQLLDAIAIGQFTPGPVLTTATFIGYLLAGIPGAVVATAAIFLPSFVFVRGLGPLIPRLRERRWTGALLDAANAAAVGLIAAVTVTLATATLTGWQAWVIAGAAAFLGLRLRVGPAWLVAGGAVAGWILA